MKIALGADHGGFELKERVKSLLAKRGIEVADAGTDGTAAVDYPDFTGEAARMVSDGEADSAIVVCTTGIGVSMAANKYPRVRAALCTSAHMAERARRHNNANVLALGGATAPAEEIGPILDAWLDHRFEGGRHERRIGKMMRIEERTEPPAVLRETDPEVDAAVRGEIRRQARQPGADRLGELREPRRARSAGLGADQQVRRGLSRQALVQRLRIRGRGRAAGHRARQGSSSAPNTPTCSRTAAAAPTWRSISPCCSRATRSWP